MRNTGNKFNDLYFLAFTLLLRKKFKCSKKKFFRNKTKQKNSTNVK